MRHTLSLARFATIVILASSLSACGNKSPAPVTPPSTPSDYSSRLKDPNVSDQEKDAIRQSMAAESGSGAAASGGAQSDGAGSAGGR